MSRFLGATALVVGGASGIGEAVALRLAGEGASVTIADIDTERGKALNGRLGIAFVEMDQRQAASVEAALMTFQKIDILSLNAGVAGSPGALVDTDEASWDRVYGVNVRGTFQVLRGAIPLMADNSSIVILGSTSGIVAHPNAAAYASSKAAVVQLSRTLALELAPKVRVNCVCPGAVKTPLLLSVLGADVEDGLRRAASESPMRRIAEPDDIAASVLFLASDEARHITGIELVVDGGSSLLART
jgi:3-oxoacyl-[acyl-carrier protein] reductase